MRKTDFFKGHFSYIGIILLIINIYAFVDRFSCYINYNIFMTLAVRSLYVY